MSRVTGWAMVSPPRPPLPGGWDASGPFFKPEDSYLAADGSNPEAPQQDYGWPLGTECWYFFLEGHGLVLHATGSTIEKAADRALEITTADDPAREGGAVR